MGNECILCPHKCGIDRNKSIGRCKASNKIMIGGANLHKFEEPCISGKNGSGTVFFSKCNLNCVFCQNYEISNLGKRKRSRGRRISRNFFETSIKKCRKHKFSITDNIHK